MPVFSSQWFADPQDAIPGDFCPVCGGERYTPSYRCIWCERRGIHDADGTE